MTRILSVHLMLAAVMIAATGSVASAQGFGRGGGAGFPSPEESFRQLDRNGNDLIDPDEWETLPPPVRRAFEDRADHSRPMGLSEYVEFSRALREEMMRRFSEGGERDQPPRERRDGSSDPQRGRSRGSGGPGGRSNAENPGSPELKSERKDSRSTASAAKPRTPINVKLPDQYRSRDTDGDGQIGFYEWPRSDFAGFRRLDLNGDGYLTPKELLRGPGPSAMPRSESNSQASTAPVVATSNTGASGASASGSAPTGDTGPKNPAETAFKLLDKNKDGSISEEEWKKSLSTGPAFAKAGITVSLPLSRNEFFRLYPQAYPNSVKK